MKEKCLCKSLANSFLVKQAFEGCIPNIIIFYQSGFSAKQGDFRPLKKTEKTKWVGTLTSVNWVVIIDGCLFAWW